MELGVALQGRLCKSRQNSAIVFNDSIFQVEVAYHSKSTYISLCQMHKDTIYSDHKHIGRCSWPILERPVEQVWTCFDKK